MLLILSGLPGTGKTTLARLLAAELRASHLRIDTIEEVLADDGREVGTLGYRLAYRLAADHLATGGTVVADCVNPVDVTRAAWRGVARTAGVASWEFEIVCSDLAEHQRRIEARLADIGRGPNWADVQRRAYDPWIDGVTRIDTAGRAPEACRDEIVAMLRQASVG